MKPNLLEDYLNAHVKEEKELYLLVKSYSEHTENGCLTVIYTNGFAGDEGTKTTEIPLIRLLEFMYNQ